MKKALQLTAIGICLCIGAAASFAVGGAKKVDSAAEAAAEAPAEAAAAPAEDVAGTGVIADKKNIKRGSLHYKQACYKCHGPNVISGNHSIVPDLRYFKGSAEEFLGIVMEGRISTSRTINMPAFFGENANVEYTLEELAQIWVYIQSVPKPDDAK